MSTSEPLDPQTQSLMDQLPQTEYGKQESWTNGKVRFEMFPEGYIALNKELATGLHPKLENLLQKHPVDEVDIKLAEIASYCQVALDATYTLAERDKLCFILAGRLEALRELPAPTVVIQ
jgi:hypothetical protein